MKIVRLKINKFKRISGKQVKTVILFISGKKIFLLLYKFFLGARNFLLLSYKFFLQRGNLEKRRKYATG